MTDASIREPHTPGLLGHVVWIAVSLVTYGVLLGMYAGAGLQGLVAVPLLVVIFGWPYAVPIGAVGAFAVYLLCRSVPEQSVHVVAAGASGLVLGALFWAGLAHTWSFGPQAVQVGVAAGAGRAAVIPLVRRRRALLLDFSAPARG